MTNDINELSTAVASLERCIRGENGTPGLLTNSILLERVANQAISTAQLNATAIQNITVQLAQLAHTVAETKLDITKVDNEVKCMNKEGTTFSQLRSVGDVDTVKHSGVRQSITIPIVVGVCMLAANVLVTLLMK